MKNSINDKECTKDILNENYYTIFQKYVVIIQNYFKHCHDNIYIQNQEYKNYIIKQGISCINHVFNFLLIYTKNLKLVCSNAEKAYIYFIEFIGQISEDNHSFLQLNSKDATLFVYKKTIFEINNDTRKNYIPDDNLNNICNILEVLMNIHNSIIEKLINKVDLINLIKLTETDLQKIMSKIIKHSIECNSLTHSKYILLFLNYYTGDYPIEHLEIFIRKLKKNPNIVLNNLEKELIDSNIGRSNNPHKSITNLFALVS
tara:strand:- start:4793 stop:5569 length:777 start_codon:yes stop_codon:yes gene_type:complete